MAGIQILKNKIPFIITLFSCVTVAALAAAVHASGGAKTAETAAAAGEQQVIVLDAGHLRASLFYASGHRKGAADRDQYAERLYYKAWGKIQCSDTDASDDRTVDQRN